MKNFINATLSLFLFLPLLMQSQTVEIENMTYLGQSIPNCGTIDFNLNSQHSIQFDVIIERDYYQNDPNLSATGILYIAYWTGSGEFIESQHNINSSSWTISQNGVKATVTKHKNIILTSNNFDDTTGGSLYARYEETNNQLFYESCFHDITKPEFHISPDNINVSCDSNSSITFTVNSINDTPWPIEDQWQLGSGWEYGGTPETSVTTSTDYIQLTPYLYPPSDVKVTPIVDFDAYDQLTSQVSLGDFDHAYQVTGTSSFCSIATYSVNNLPAGTTVTSWSVSNTSIATISSNGNQATLTAIGNGTVDITATLTNSCNQTAPITKNNIDVGAPAFPNTAMSGETTPVVGESKYYSVPEASGATSYYWYFDVGNGQTGTNIDGWQIQQGQGTTGIFVKVGNPGSTYIVCRATNSCGERIKYKYVSPRTPSDPCDEFLRIGSNPIKSDNLAGRPIWIEDPCDDFAWKTNSLTKEASEKTKSTIDIYNSFGRLVYSKTQLEKEFDISGLEKGFYFVKYQTKKGKLITKKFIVK